MINIIFRENNIGTIQRDDIIKNRKRATMVSSKQRKTMKKIFEDPIPIDVTFRDAIALLKSLGAEISEGKGSRVRIFINGTVHILHKPHGNKSDGSISRKEMSRHSEN